MSLNSVPLRKKEKRRCIRIRLKEREKRKQKNVPKGSGFQMM